LATELVLSRATQERLPAPYARWAALVSLLLAELLALTFWFDTGVLAEDSWWEIVVGYTPALLRIGVCMAAATILVSGPAVWKTLVRCPGEAFRWPVLLVHLGSFALLTALTAVVMQGGLHTSLRTLVLLGGWLAAGVITLATWGLATLPAGTWRHLGRTCWPGLAAGAVAGLVAFLFGLVATEFWKPLGEGTLWLVFHLVQLVFGNAVIDPGQFVVGTSSFAVAIEPECSGYEGIGLITAFSAIYLWLFRHSFRFPHALLLLPAGMLAIWLCNAVRIALLIGLGTYGWEEAAVGGFHSQAGWLAFNAVALGLVFLSGRIGFVAAEPVDAPDTGRRESTVAATNAFLAPFLTSVAGTMVVAAFAANFEWLHPLRVVAVLGVLWLYRGSYASLGWTWSWTTGPALGTLTFLLWIMLTPGNPGDEFWRGTDLSLLPTGAAFFFVAMRLLGFVVAIPLAEELAFRAYLTRRLQSADFTEIPLGRFSWLGLLGSSVLFGVLHGPYWLPGILAGILFGVALYRRGRIGDAVVAHATANALIALSGISELLSSRFFVVR
jgi:exosortase E/protease (VPEID-CTERM system)